MGETNAPAGKVMRHPGIKMPFQRTIPTGEVLRFEPGVPVELDSIQMEGVLNDLGTALVVVETDNKGRPRIDWDLTKAVRDNERPLARREAAEQAEVAFELSDALMDLLELHADSFVEMTPVGVQAFLDDGGKLESLDGFTPELQQELLDALAAKMPDVSLLVAAGVPDDLVEKLAANVTGEANQWLLDPDQIRAKVAAGFKLDRLGHGIGPVAAKKILQALGIE